MRRTLAFTLAASLAACSQSVVGDGTPDADTPDADTPDAGTPDVGTPDAGTLLCTPGTQVACACPGAAQGVQVCAAGGTLGPCACGDAGTTPAGPGAYEACTPGQVCGGGTACASASFTSGGAANLCTTTCSIGVACPDAGTNPAYLPTCVVNGLTGVGQCYDSCSTNLDCGAGTQCRVIPGTSSQICVPIGTGGTIQSPLPAAYTSCTPAGAACGSSTTCIPSMFSRAGAPQGNLCTLACTSGNAAMCPGYVPGAAFQSVECVAPRGNPMTAQCMRLCNPANANRDCAPYFTTCAAVQMAAGPINVCVP